MQDLKLPNKEKDYSKVSLPAGTLLYENNIQFSTLLLILNIANAYVYVTYIIYHVLYGKKYIHHRFKQNSFESGRVNDGVSVKFDGKEAIDSSLREYFELL